MIQFLLRKKTDGITGSLSVRVKNSITDFQLSCDYTLPLKDWSCDAQCLKCYTDTAKRPFLGMLSYAELSQRMFKFKEVLEQQALQDLTKDFVRDKIATIMHNKKAEKKTEEYRKPTFLEFIQQYADECKDGTRKCFRSTANISAETIKGYLVLRNKILAFQDRHHKVIDWDDITLPWLRLWKKDLAEEYSTNYIAHLISILKRIMNAGREMHYTTCMDYTMREFGGSWEEVDNVYLTHSMLDDLWKADFTDTASTMERIKKIDNKDLQAKAALLILNNSMESLQNARDLFLVGCSTGQRISDYKRINDGFIVRLRDGRDYIDIEQKKTKKRVFIPVDSRVREILEKHHGVLPSMADPKLNSKLKDIGLLMGWVQPTLIKDRKTGNNKRFFECMASHTARRTFATLAYEDGISASAIMAITGHSSEDTFRKYIKTSAKDRAIIAAEEFYNVRKLEA